MENLKPTEQENNPIQNTEIINETTLVELTDESVASQIEETTTEAEEIAYQVEFAPTIEQRKNIVNQLDELYNNQSSDLSETLAQFRKLQTEWKTLDNNPTENTHDVWKEYSVLNDKFFDLSKINRELIEYNFKKNLALKQSLCAKAEELKADEDIVKSFRALQVLHKEWKEIGPVSREHNNEIWENFKTISSDINNRYTEYINQNKAKYDEIISAKINWCIEIESIDITTLLTYKEWEAMADRIKEINKFFIVENLTDHKKNQQLYKRLRTACDNFFEAKSKFYAVKKDEMQANLEKKIELMTQAEAIKDNKDWKNTTNKIINLQKQWTTIGPTNHKNSKSTWERFIAACDYFFEQKNKLYSSKKDEERNNMQLKMELTERILQFELSDNEDDNIEALKTFNKQYNEIGHVPFKEKDKVYEAFKDAIDSKYDSIRIKFHIEGRNYGNNRQKLQKKYEQLKTEIATYENNIGFLSTSKSSSPILKDMQRKINNLKVEVTAVLNQLNNLE